ncbi:AMP-binding protein [Kocuria rosea]|uniref:AMP-binding protein n=1 Tax=Kocuria rosea TaxID=1275 RepID=UPI000F705A2E|nr:AMP-binding protein [Kocuria rosea]VEI51290.1 Long-chain-fatty-acid--CoA ligase [Kocuria rosea]
MSQHAHWLTYQATRVPERTALRDLATGRSFTYREMLQRVQHLAGHLDTVGITKGDRVAVLSRNSSNVFEVLYACAAVGAVMVPLNWRLSTAELQAVTADFDPSLVLHDTESAAVAGELTAASVPLLGWGGDADAYEAAMAASAPLTRPVPTDEDDPWVIIYTSGTTGLPKGAVHTFRSVRANIESSAFAGDVHGDSVVLTALPTFHVAGLHLFGNAALMHGGTNVVMESFDSEQTLRLFGDSSVGVTHFCGVPAMFQLMASLPGFAEARLRPVVIAVGGSPVPRTLVDQWTAKGVSVMADFGATEAGATILTMPPRGSKGPSAIGIPVIHAECSVRDLDGSELAAGQIGELWVRGPLLMQGYWNKSEETAKAITPEGWFKTGDAAQVDEDGIFHIVDRWKDMYISGGENVYPAEVESVLYQHPDVVLASVVGVPHERWGETGRAFVVLSGAATTTADELRTWCCDRLAAYKVPTHVDFLEDLPRNATGKILKKELRTVMSR